ncbi:helix-turn-helix domain-containing protein [Algoriphagus sanaruensis]|uniref:Helicase n=1 Tax=Algoriphagus sanaruensis TaxID=1727163 RepID=A0A142EM09_9BACT|nr:helix-turn-helix domain-containing protein [Algoriphagus sanaruensis]AMQ56164.1 helicase [Algoriphagus sanaruensis]
MENFSTDRLRLAAQFVNTTSAPIFLTGKAGTGKTTFLRELALTTYKRFVIVAPTGIAALNAGGVTIHSQFLLPFGSFLPVRETEGNYTQRFGFVSQSTLARKHPLNKFRKDVLKSIDLLVIDEVSMLRADVLDAIDYRLRSVKRRYSTPFGGIQVLFIGDLYQLPPVVKDEEWEVMKQFYASMHFFEAKALKDSGMIYLELDKIFRQQDETFIRILNNLRDNRPSLEDIRILNSHYKTPEQIRDLKDCITLTTHNYKADEINRRELTNLPGESFFYLAEIENDFPEALFPLPKALELKVGARIMFIKNDTSGLASYFNGKLATVLGLEEDEILVEMDGDRSEYTLKKELWENKKYQIHPDTKELEEELIGTFSHYPIKLAWAVTVHKSQGLTFDQAIIDVGQAFAPGQVYVALSRLRSIEGLILGTRIREDVLYTDPKVVSFVQSADQSQNLQHLLIQRQGTYLQELIDQTFEVDSLIFSLRQFAKEHDSSMAFEDPEMEKAIPEVYGILESELENTRKFRSQLFSLLLSGQREKLQVRLEKGMEYYLALIRKPIEIILLQELKTESLSRIKSYQNDLSELELELLKKFIQIARVGQLIHRILEGEIPGKIGDFDQEAGKMRLKIIQTLRIAHPDLGTQTSTKSGRKKSKSPKTSLSQEPKEKKEDTKAWSIRLFQEGKTPGEIAADRGLALSTIIGHLAHGVKQGKIHLHELVEPEVAQEVLQVDPPLEGLKAYFDHFEGKIDYETLRAILDSRPDPT